MPSNTAQGYVMRRFVRRAIRQALALGLQDDFFEQVVPIITKLYRDDFPEFAEREDDVIKVLMAEETQFRKTLDKGLKEFDFIARIGVGEGEPGKIKYKSVIYGKEAFKLFDTYGFPLELTVEEAHSRDIKLSDDFYKQYEYEMYIQKERSRTATVGQFKGGLADHSDTTVKYHTATHLMYKALRIVLGDHVVQRGSNITPERLRFDFSHGAKMTPEQLAKVEQLVNDNIAKDWPMGFREIPTEQAFAEGALGAFGDKYGDAVKVYTAGDPDGEWYSKEICGGPHVEHTGLLSAGGKKFKIKKEESSSSGVRRIKAVLE